VVFDDKMWVISGINSSGLPNNVLSSTNGVTWNEVYSDADEFSRRWKHSSVVFDDGKGEKMWVIAGSDHGSFTRNDVWNSTDGKTWARIKDNNSSGFRRRELHSSVVFDKQMWVIGGLQYVPQGDGTVNDVWSSTNGATWDRIKDNNSDGFSVRRGHTSVAFNDGSSDGEKIWVIGGINSSNVRLNDVWNSTDGKTWTPVKANNSEGFSARIGHTSVVFDNKMWVIGGFDGTLKDDVWSSTNGVTWNEETDNPGFTGRYNHTSVMFKNKIWFMAGSDSLSNTSKNDVWYMVKD
jgi:dihydrofolate reductase